MMYKPHEIQQSQVQGPAPRLGQSQVWIQAGQWLKGEQPGREGLEGGGAFKTEL